MHNRIAPALAAVLSASGLACHDFGVLEADGRCGNGILEPASGEDCDSNPLRGDATCGSPGSEQACRYTCADEVPCPGGWRCGADDICRAPSPRFTQRPSIFHIPGGSLARADVDGDGRADLINVGTAGFSVGFADPGGGFSGTVSIEIPARRGEAVTGDLDGDGAADIAIPMGEGAMVVPGSRARTLVPIAFPFAEVQSPMRRETLPFPIRAAPPYTKHVTLVIEHGGGAQPSAKVLESTLPVEAMALGPALGMVMGQPVQRQAIADVTGSPAGEELALTREGATSVAILALECTESLSCALRLRQVVALPAGASIARGGSFFADADGDGNLDLLLGVRSGGSNAVAIARGDGRGALRQAAIERGFAPVLTCAECPAEGAGLLAAGDLDGDGKADYVTAAGIAVTTSTASGLTLSIVLGAPPPGLNEAVIADFNRDRNADVATTRGAEQAVFVILGAGDHEFNTLEVPTSAPPRLLQTGDFDGDLSQDIALVEGRGTVSVLFGDRYPKDRVVMAQVEAVSFFRSLVGLARDDRISDLMIVGEPRMGSGDEMGPFIRLDGTSARRMISFAGNGSRISALAIGRFRAGGSDLLVVGQSQDTVVSFISGSREGYDVRKSFPRVDDLQLSGDCGVLDRAVALRAGAIGAREAEIEGRLEDLLALDIEQVMEGAPPPPLVVLDVEPRADKPNAWRIACTPLEPPPTLAGGADIELADLDGDGVRDALLSYSPFMVSGGMGPDQIPPNGIAVWWGQADAASPFEPGPYEAVIAAPNVDGRVHTAHVDADGSRPGREIVLLSNGSMSIKVVDKELGLGDLGGVTIPPAGVPTGSGMIRGLRGADANGDGLDDVILNTETEVYVWTQRACEAQETVPADGSNPECSRPGESE